MNCGKAAREGALGCDLGTPFVNSSAPAEPQGRTHPPQWASSEQPPQAALSESECSHANRMILRPDGITSQAAIYRCKRLCRLISLSNTTCSSLRIGRVPAVIGYCRPWSHCYTPACPSGGGFAFTAGTTIKYFRGCRPTGKPRWLKRATGTFLRADAPFRACV